MALPKRILMLSIVLPSAVALGIAVYFLNMPAWIIVERTEREPDRSVIEIPESVLSDFPKLREALDKADESYHPRLPGSTITMASSFDGYGILQSVRSHGAASSDDNNSKPRLFIENEGKQYSLHVVFGYSAPGLA